MISNWRRPTRPVHSTLYGIQKTRLWSLKTEYISSLPKGGKNARSKGNVGRIDGFFFSHICHSENAQIHVRIALACRARRGSSLGRSSVSASPGAGSYRANRGPGVLLLLDSLLPHHP